MFENLSASGNAATFALGAAIVRAAGARVAGCRNGVRRCTGMGTAVPGMRRLGLIGELPAKFTAGPPERPAATVLQSGPDSLTVSGCLAGFAGLYRVK